MLFPPRSRLFLVRPMRPPQCSQRTGTSLKFFFKNSYSQELVEIQSINLPREAILRVSNDMQEQDDYISMEFTKFNIPPGS